MDATFKIQGQVCHRVGVLHHLPGQALAFLLIYLSGTELAEPQTRAAMFSNETEPDVILNLKQILWENSNYVRSFKDVMEHPDSSNENFRVIIRTGKLPPRKHDEVTMCQLSPKLES